MRYWRALCLPATLKRGREMYSTPRPAGRVGIDIETIRGSTRLGSLPLQRYGGPVQDSPGRPESQYRRPESQYRIHASQYRIHASQYRIHVTHY